MSSDWSKSNSNPFIDPETILSNSNLKPLPLPDDILGFDNIIEPSNYGPPVDINFKDLSNSQKGNGIDNDNDNENDNDFLDSNSNDIESILFDLGISERTSQIQHPNCTKTHKRKISGSGIFGYVGLGSDTQLAIPGMQPTPVSFNNKKPLYQPVNKFDNIDYSKVHQPIDPEDILIKNRSNNSASKQGSSNECVLPEFILTGGKPDAYKFPRSPRQPSLTKNYSVQELKSLRSFHTDIKGYKNKEENENDGPDATTSLKPIESVEDLDRMLECTDETELINANKSIPITSSPLKSLSNTLSLLSSPNKLISTPIKRNLSSNNYRNSNDNNDDTISTFATPLRVKNTFMDFKTPSPQKTPSKISWFPTLITKKNNLSEKIIKEQKRSPIRKKKPTITSTLATGTLDQYFVGPDLNGKYTCKFKEKGVEHECKREFTRISNVRAHIQTHLSDRPFVCDHCGKAFVRNHDLRRHAKVHEEFEYSCPCGKKFPRQDALKRHRIRNICTGGIVDSKTIKKNKKNSKTMDEKDEEILIAKIDNDNDIDLIRPVKKKLKFGNNNPIYDSSNNDNSNILFKQQQEQIIEHQRQLMQLQEQQKILESKIQLEQKQCKNSYQFQDNVNQFIPTHSSNDTIPPQYQLPTQNSSINPNLSQINIQGRGNNCNSNFLNTINPKEVSFSNSLFDFVNEIPAVGEISFNVEDYNNLEFGNNVNV